MKDFKVIQMMNNLLKKEPEHQHEFIIEHDENTIIERSFQYFSQECLTLSYPSKSFCVAIIYSHLLNFYFGEDFYESLNDANLLCQNDDYFLPYLANRVIYDRILKQIDYSNDKFELDLKLSQVKSTFDYFTEEFDVDPGKYLGHFRNHQKI